MFTDPGTNIKKFCVMRPDKREHLLELAAIRHASTGYDYLIQYAIELIMPSWFDYQHSLSNIPLKGWLHAN